MYYANSSEYFEISIGPQPDNTLQARLLCLKDFLKRCAIFPFALIAKACKTVFRFVGICFSVLFVLITLGSSFGAREMFVARITCFAKDLADWVLLPLALLLYFVRLILALVIHPTFYSNAI
jgi:hypothetical protein